MDQNAVLNLDEFEIIEKIGEDFFGIYMKSIEKVSRKQYIFNFLKIDQNDKYSIKSALKDTSIFFKLNHPGITRYERFQIPTTESTTQNSEIEPTQENLSKFIIASEYPINGPLSKLNEEYLQSKGKNCEMMNPTIRSKIIFGVAAAMKYIQSLNFINHNLSMKSIFLDENFEPKIANFGIYFMSRNMNFSDYDLYDLSIFAPEILSDNDDYDDYKPNVDVYAFAFVVYFMFSDKLLFKKHLAKMRTLIEIKKGNRPDKPELMPDCYWELVKKCWNNNDVERPSFSEIIEILRNDSFALNEFGMKTDIDKLHEYQEKVSDIEGINFKC